MWVNSVQHHTLMYMTNCSLHHECWPQCFALHAKPTRIVEHHINGINVRIWVNSMQHCTLMYMTNCSLHHECWPQCSASRVKLTQIVENHVNGVNVHMWVNSVQHHTLMGLSVHVRVKYDIVPHLWNHACVGYYYWSKFKITTSKHAIITTTQ